MIYLDYNATTPLDQRVRDAIIEALNEFGNPSSTHIFGKKARMLIDNARHHVSKLIGAKKDEIIFTSGGTESNNLAILGIALKQGKGHIITSSIEHPSVLNPLRYLESKGFSVTYIQPDKDGMVSPDDVIGSIRKDTILVSIMHANNETGVIQPVSEIGKILMEKEIPFHTDAAQSAGKIHVNVDELNVSLLTIVSHKFYGPKGIGALYIREGIEISPIMFGGGHERGIRPGTENIPGIAGMGKAAEITIPELNERKNHMERITNLLLENLSVIPDIRLNGHRTFRLPNTINLMIPGIYGDELVTRLSGSVAFSSGAACHAGKRKPSHVLKAMGLSDEEAMASIRLSTGKDTTEEEVIRASEIIVNEIKRLRTIQ